MYTWILMINSLSNAGHKASEDMEVSFKKAQLLQGAAALEGKQINFKLLICFLYIIIFPVGYQDIM